MSGPRLCCALFSVAAAPAKGGSQQVCESNEQVSGSRNPLLDQKRETDGRLKLSCLSSIMAGVAAWLDAQGGLDTLSQAQCLAPHPAVQIRTPLNKMR